MLCAVPVTADAPLTQPSRPGSNGDGTLVLDREFWAATLSGLREAVLACASAGGLIGSLAAARTGRLRMPTLFTAAVAGMAIAFCLVPYVGEAGAAAAMLVIGACTGLANVVVLTVVHKQIPAAVLGRVMSAFMLCAFGSYPLSVLVAGLIVRHLGPAPYFPVAGAMLAVVMIAGLTQRGFRRFGTGAGTVQGLRRARSRKNGVDTHS